ncbi:MAG: threonyl-tRNA synthetase, partial [uncultured bacterium]
LSFKDPEKPQNYIGEEADWKIAQRMLLDVNDELNLGGKVMIGEAALYGPKIDIMLKDALGNDRQLGTVQVDFAMPKRFGLVYTDKDGQEKTPVMLHRAILGSYGRFIANLMENTGGAFPVWLAPLQVSIIPIGEKHNEYAEKVKEKLLEKQIRVEINDKAETMQARIRDAQNHKVPYMLIIGDREVENGQVSVRLRSGENIGAIKLEEVIEKINSKYLTKALDLW